MAPNTRQQSPAAVARREERRQAKREIVLRATLDIINEGDINPSMPKIVARSGIPERSVFRYFDDIADLTRQTIALALQDLSDIEGLTHIGEGDLDGRIDSLIAARLELLERVRYLSRVARMRVFLAPDLDNVLNEALSDLRNSIDQHFATELARMSDAEAASAVDAVMSQLTFETYDVMRRRLERTLDEIAASWRFALRRLLT